MNFEKSLEKGKEYEKIVLSKIRRKYECAYIVDGYFKPYDIFVPELQFGVEVKFDEKSIETGNIVIEVEFNGKPSGLTTTEAKYWVICDGYEYNWFLVTDIKKCINDNKLIPARFIGNGDVSFKLAYLIKKNILYKYKYNGKRATKFKLQNRSTDKRSFSGRALL